MTTEQIVLENGWNPGFDSGTQVVALQNFWTIKAGDIVTYSGGCDHPDHGWEIFFKDSKITVAGYMFENGFRKVVKA